MNKDKLKQPTGRKRDKNREQKESKKMKHRDLKRAGITRIRRISRHR